MKYSEMRDQFKTGDIIALSHDKWGSLYDLQMQAIRIFTQSEFTHVGIVWVFGGRVFLIESVQPVVRVIPLSNVDTKGFYHIPVGKDFSDEELQFLLSKVGLARYSKWQAILAYFRKLKIGADNAYECAELAIEARRKSGVDLGDTATPSAVVQTLLEAGHALFYIEKA